MQKKKKCFQLNYLADITKLEFYFLVKIFYVSFLNKKNYILVKYISYN